MSRVPINQIGTGFFNLLNQNYMNTFEEFKSKIIENAKTANACEEEFNKAVKSENFKELCKVLNHNFSFAIEKKVLTPEIFAQYTDELANEKLFHNTSVTDGYLFASESATVRASGSATVEAWGSATVRASESATVRASESATVRASGSATVRASESATVRAWGSAYTLSKSINECKLSEKAICRVGN